MNRIMRIIVGAVAFFGYIGLSAFHVQALETEEGTVSSANQTTKKDEAPSAFLASEIPVKSVNLAKKKDTPTLNNDNASKDVESKKTEQNVERTLKVEATAYTANCDGCIGITKTGINLLENPNKKVIAVDPSVIPLGSIVHVEGYGKAVAGDIGSAIQGNRIDVFIPNRNNALNFGRRHGVTVKILEEA
ncbi:hypothetical protein GLW08_03345 [Pontibacillus yanchengensis]|uniref:Uncharacterized protein n=2 Tax=Pontibacillus yanchengensis TaxID=462910 RepID=A0ACC7VDV5_9BACI|nr:3D domain-containing protein [Pontibacillus yanchengensis]MYL35340.1 hypothetical protein [Pontibacillus yanchengensis]MYL52369.1 hypothetical protein [Pontibacillus yanchengensis]